MTVTVAEILRRAGELTEVSDTARLDTEILICRVLGKERTFLFTWPDHVLTDRQLADFEAAFQRRKRGEPVAHITGEREFWSLPLKVNPSTLIPRPDTELLVEAGLNLSLPEHARVLDLGTGTGAIALALASEKPNWQITATDLQAEAVALATSNRNALGFENVELLQSDWYAALREQRFDLIVSNPPYIDPLDPHLSQGDVRFEPLSALTAENSGLADIEIIAAGAVSRLIDGGWLIVEHGYDQGKQIRTIFENNGFQQVVTRRDYGGNDRITMGCVGR